MAAYSSTITYNGYTLYINSLSVKKVQATRKQVIGKSIIRIQIPGITEYEREIQISGIIFSTAITGDTQRDNLIASEDGASHAYVDGKHNANYYITALNWDDADSDVGNVYRYTLTLVED